MNEGIFTQPGPDGIFGRGGPSEDASSPSIDSDGQNLRETLVAVFPSPGHMRVARALRNIKTGTVEKHEEYRVPTAKEVALLAQQGVRPQPLTAAALGNAAPAGVISGIMDQPWLKLAGAAAVGAGAFWAINKFVIPRVLRQNPDDDEDDEDEEDETITKRGKLRAPRSAPKFSWDEDDEDEE